MEIMPPPEPPEVVVPWKSFKAFCQLFDIREGERPRKRWVNPVELLALSDTPSGARTRAPLLANDLIEPTPEGGYAIRRGVPYGRFLDDPEPGEPVVCPSPRSAAGAAWLRTYGCCTYCGKPLRFFSQLALGAAKEGGMRMFACKRCHAKRGYRPLEEFRFLVEMDEFQRRYGVRFDRRQVEFLRQMGVELDLRPHEFWFERYDPDVK